MPSATGEYVTTGEHVTSGTGTSSTGTGTSGTGTSGTSGTEKDLGVKVVPRLCWNEHCQLLISSARSRLGLTKRTCHFIKNRRQRLILYKTMVRSLFQHCAEIRRPSTKVPLSKFEAVQKRAVKWVFMEDHEHYS